MNSYIPKPFRPQELIVGIAQALNIELRLKKVEVEKKISSPEPMNSKVTDLAYLRDFCKEDEQKMEKYIGMFTKSVPGLLDKLTTARHEEDYETIASQVHGFKTKWIMMGMTRAKTVSDELENNCRNSPDKKDIEVALNELFTLVSSAMTELESNNV